MQFSLTAKPFFKSIFITLILTLFCLQCFKSREKKTKTHFNQHNPIQLSHIILEGIRHLIDELLISEVWFRNSDVTINAKKNLLLHAKIFNFSLNGDSTRQVYTHWKIFVKAKEEFKYINILTFDENENKTVNKDSLFLNVYKISPEIFDEKYKLPDQIKVTYWPKGYKKQHKLITLTMIKNKKDHYQVIH